MRSDLDGGVERGPVPQAHCDRTNSGDHELTNASGASPGTAKGRLVDPLLLGEDSLDDLPSQWIFLPPDADGIRSYHWP
jgi:hypothetical protein